MGQGLCLGPAQKGRGSMWKGGPLECEVLEFGSRALSEGVWVGLRPSAVGGRGSPSVEMGPWLGV